MGRDTPQDIVRMQVRYDLCKLTAQPKCKHTALHMVHISEIDLSRAASEVPKDLLPSVQGHIPNQSEDVETDSAEKNHGADTEGFGQSQDVGTGSEEQSQNNDTRSVEEIQLERFRACRCLGTESA